MNLYFPLWSCLSKLTEIDNPLGSSGKNTSQGRLYADAGARHPSTPRPGLVPNQHQTRHRNSPPEWYQQRRCVHPRRREHVSRGPLGHGEVAQRTAGGVQYVPMIRMVSDGGLGKVGITVEKSVCLLVPCARARRTWCVPSYCQHELLPIRRGDRWPGREKQGLCTVMVGSGVTLAAGRDMRASL